MSRPRKRPTSDSAVRPPVRDARAASTAPEQETPAPETGSPHVTGLGQVSEALGADKSPKEVLELILKAARSITRASSASLMLIVPGSDVLRVEAAEGFHNRRIYATRLKVGEGITGWVAQTGVALRVGDTRKDPRYVQVQSGLRSELAVPLKIRGRVMGVISVDSTRVNHFTPEDAALLTALAAHSARVIHTTRLYEETSRRAAELKLLIESSRVLTSTLDLGEVLDKLVALAADFWRVPIVAVYLTAEDGEHLRLAAAHGGTPAFRALSPLPVQGTLLGRVLGAAAEAVAVADLSGEVAPAARPVLDAEGLGTALAVPLRAKERPLGVLALFAPPGRVFESEERRLLCGLAGSAALAIENAHAHRKVLMVEESLREAEKSALLVELAAGLAHEIRNPLTSIKILFGSLVRAEAFSGGDAGDVRMVQRQLERLEQIVENYLRSARARASASQLRARALDLNAVVEEALMLLANSSRQGTRLTCVLSPGELKVQGDPTQLSQAVYNLVLNAIQALSPEGEGEALGRVEVRTGRGEASGTEGVFFEVADDGPGLSPEVQERLFQPFVSTKKQGVGLGLSIVKRVVEAHGGRLTVESPRAGLGRGVAFRVYLPEARG